MRYRYIILLMATILLGCTKESGLGGNEPLHDVSVRIMLSNSSNVQQPKRQTKTGEPPVNNNPASENYVEKIQVFFYNSDNKLECVRQYLKGQTNDEIVWSGESAMTVNRVSNLGQPKNIYVVTNWLMPLPTQITVGSDITLLTKQITRITAATITPSQQTPLLMSGGITNYLFHEKGQTTVKNATITLRRQAAKIEIKVQLDPTFHNTVSSNHTFGNAKLSVYNLPAQSFVMEQVSASLPTGSTMFDPFTVDITNNSNAWNYKLYSYENPQTGKLPGDKIGSTYFNLNIPYTKITSSGVSETHDNYYSIYIDDTSDDTNPHKTLRNSHYTITVTLTGFGTEKPEFDAIHARITMTTWGSEELDQDVSGKNITINKTSVVVKGSEVDKSLIIRGTTNLDQSLITSEKLLSTPIYYPDGMNPEQQGLKLDCESGDDKKSITITIQNRATAPYTGGKATTFYLQYGTFKKKISVTYMQ